MTGTTGAPASRGVGWGESDTVAPVDGGLAVRIGESGRTFRIPHDNQQLFPFPVRRVDDTRGVLDLRPGLPRPVNALSGAGLRPARVRANTLRQVPRTTPLEEVQYER